MRCAAAAVALLLPATGRAWRREGLVAPATDTELAVPGLEAGLEGSGSGALAWLSLTGDSGEARRGGWRYGLVAYAGQAGFGGYDLVDALAVREDGGDVMVLYGYCYRGGRLASVWTEGYGLGGSQEAMSGSCELRRDRNLTVHVQLPALRALPEPLGVGGLSVSGSRVALGPDGGWILTRQPGGSGTVNQTLRPFGLVDCTDCPGGPWLEVHSMLDTAPTGACFGILYIFPETSRTVELGYSICMPSMDRVDATYEVDAVTGLRPGRQPQPPLLAATGLAAPRLAVPWPSQLPRRPPPSRLAFGGPPAAADLFPALMYV